MSSSLYKIINRDVGKAIHAYDMIDDGDRIMVGLSGGKDSLTLLWILRERLSRVPIHYDIIPVYIDPGFEGGYHRELIEYVKKMDFHLRVEMTDYGIISHSDVNRENPCFLCSRLRRKRLFELMDELNCNKLALGHHKDDIIETFFLNVCYSAEISTLLPSQTFFGGAFKMIRPLAYLDEDVIKRFSKQMYFPVFENPCPSSKRSKRKEIKDILNDFYRGNRKVKGNIFRALHNVKPEYLLKKKS